MKLRIIFIALSLFGSPAVLEAETLDCMAFVGKGENYKAAHVYEPCLFAAKAGDGRALYAVGMSYGYAGNEALELEYYRKAAKQSVVASYLALGHALREKDINESISWYEKFVETKPQGYGYVALQLSRLYKIKGNEKRSNYWLGVCKESPYKENCGST